MIDLKNTPYWSIYMDVFNLHKKFSEPVESDEFWNALVAEADSLCRKYRASSEGEFAKKLLLAILEEIERSYKATNVHNGNT